MCCTILLRRPKEVSYVYIHEIDLTDLVLQQVAMYSILCNIFLV